MIATALSICSGQDLQRYLDGLPVHAHRGSRLYRARKFLGRHRVESAAAALVALSLAVGTGVAVRQATIASHERDRAQRALAEAEQSIKQSESVTGFLVGLFDATTPNPGATTVTAQELLRRGATQLEAFPRTAARAGPHARDDGARPHDDGRISRSASGARAVARAASRGTRPQSCRSRGNALLSRRDDAPHRSAISQADSLARRALAIRTAALGPRHPANAEVLLQLASIALYLSDLNGAAECRAARSRSVARRSAPTIRSSPRASTLYAATLRRLDRNDRSRGGASRSDRRGPRGGRTAEPRRREPPAPSRGSRSVGTGRYGASRVADAFGVAPSRARRSASIPERVGRWATSPTCSRIEANTEKPSSSPAPASRSSDERSGRSTRTSPTMRACS